MYTLKFKGKSHAVSGKLFWSLALPMLAVFALLVCWAGWLIYLCTHMLEHYLGIPAFICGLLVLVLLGSVTIDQQVKSLLPARLQTVLGLCLAWGTVYFEYAVRRQGVLDLALLATPLAVFGLRRLLKKSP